MNKEYLNELLQQSNIVEIVLQQIQNNQLKIHSNYFQCNTIEDFQFHKQRLHCRASIDKFIYRIIESYYNNTTYCGHHWKVERIND